MIDRKTVSAVPMDETQRDELISQFRSRGLAAFLSAYSEAAGARERAPPSVLYSVCF